MSSGERKLRWAALRWSGAFLLLALTVARAETVSAADAVERPLPSPGG